MSLRHSSNHTDQEIPFNCNDESLHEQSNQGRGNEEFRSIGAGIQFKARKIGVGIVLGSLL